MQPVRRNDAADGLVLHVLELRQQHGLRLIVEIRGAAFQNTPARYDGRSELVEALTAELNKT
jgi:hypothetical protein